MKMLHNVLDKAACHAGMWALRRLFGADCKTDVNSDWPEENLRCLSCDAKRLVGIMQDILDEN